MSVEFEDKGYSVLRLKHLRSIIAFKEWLVSRSVMSEDDTSYSKIIAYLDFIEEKTKVRTLKRTLNNKADWLLAIEKVRSRAKEMVQK
jgi:hypothetical protein